MCLKARTGFSTFGSVSQTGCATLIHCRREASSGSSSSASSIASFQLERYVFIKLNYEFKNPSVPKVPTNFGPTWWRRLAPTWTHLGATSARVEVHMASKWGTWPAQYEIVKTRVFTVIFRVFCYWWCFVWRNVHLARSCRQSVPSCGMLGLTWASANFQVDHVNSIWGPSGSLWSQFQPNMSTWRQLGLQLGPGQRNWDPLGAAPAQAGPNPSQFCGLNATCWKLAFLPLFPTFLQSALVEPSTSSFGWA